MDFDSFVLAASTGDLAEEPAARGRADAVEFRMDLATDPLDALAAYDGELPIVATNRAVWEGGEAAGEGRLDALSRAAAFDAVEAIDVELASLRGTAPDDVGSGPDRAADLCDRARDHGAAVIVSVHDFESTPPGGELRESLAAAAAAGDVGKLAVTATDRADALALLSATHDATAAGERVATMAMGEAGRHTRAVAPIYGSKIGYAPVEPARATAPGQYDLATLASLIDRLS
ncbi:type I 3-dehydroquinate dehydratase [Halegenticoccus tardaugens]|uniref:type I 3-dehydroquinate dehydratase n=1 Tax=Halegenticoccus tardaugens TaxID=2071624 RepID=UPI00100A95AA|nr:type I 3-dehydroquinate dehydratase [Halegenticoccus tardaugens]